MEEKNNRPACLLRALHVSHFITFELYIMTLFIGVGRES